MSVQNFTSRTSVREYNEEKLTEEEMEVLFSIINNSPTSTNAQQFSALLVTDEKMLEWLSEKNWNQKGIAGAAGVIIFLADRTGLNFIMEHSKIELSPEISVAENFRAMQDATIASTYTMMGLISMGFGTVYMGGVPNYGEELIEKFNLPPTAWPVIAVAFGKPAKINEFKPKIDKAFLNEYITQEKIIRTREYIEETRQYFAARGQDSWDMNVGRNFKNPELAKTGKYYMKKITETK